LITWYNTAITGWATERILWIRRGGGRGRRFRHAGCSLQRVQADILLSL